MAVAIYYVWAIAGAPSSPRFVSYNDTLVEAVDMSGNFTHTVCAVAS